jgi:predicted nucleic acid-binding protein
VDKIFLDANVLFLAAYRTHAGLHRLWQMKDVELITSEYAAEEARRNLSAETSRRRLRILLQSVQVITPIPQAVPALEIELPEKDRPILLASIQAGATHLLTGDKQHFGAYFGRRIHGVLILPPSEYFRRVGASDS